MTPTELAGLIAGGEDSMPEFKRDDVRSHDPAEKAGRLLEPRRWHRVAGCRGRWRHRRHVAQLGAAAPRRCLMAKATADAVPLPEAQLAAAVGTAMCRRIWNSSRVGEARPSPAEAVKPPA